MRHVLQLVVLCTSLLQRLHCFPDTLTERGQLYFTKYGWPVQAWSMMLREKIPADTFTDEQAHRYVTLGMAYLEKLLTSPNQLINSLGNNHELISASMVKGIDDAANLNLRPRWRWLPLIESIDQDGNFVHRTSKWSRGTTLKSMDLLRLDSFNWHKVRLIVPTAIVRPIEHEKGFGQGLQFHTVYEFPTSFAHYLRQPTLATAEQLHAAIRRDSKQWLSKLSPRRRTALRDQNNLVSVKWLQGSLQAYMENARKNKWPADIETVSVDEDTSGFASPAKRVRSAEMVPAADLAHHISAPRPVIPLRSWDGRAFSDQDHEAALQATVHSSGDLNSPGNHALLQQQQQQQPGPSSQDLQLSRFESSTQAVARTPVHLSSVDRIRDGAWLQLGSPNAAVSIGEGSSSASPVQGRTGIARWRRPPQKPSESPESSS